MISDKKMGETYQTDLFYYDQQNGYIRSNLPSKTTVSEVRLLLSEGNL